MLGLLFLFAIVAAVLAVIFFAQARANGAAVVTLRAEADAAGKQADAARGQVRELQTDGKAKTAQLVELREKLADARKKGQESKAGKQQSRGAREGELLEDLGHARKLTEDAHAAEAQARKDGAAAKADVTAARVQLGAAQEKIRELSEKLATVSAQAIVPPVQAASPAPKPPSDDARLAELAAKVEGAEQRAAAAENGLREARKREQAQREEAKKARGRAETNNRVFLVTKGELELVKERLAQAERRLWQAGIALPVPQAKERPKATGPAAAERAVVEAPAGSSPSQAAGETTGAAPSAQAAPILSDEGKGAAAPDAPGEGAQQASGPADPADSAEPDAPGEGSQTVASAAEADAPGEGSPQAVLPLRRRPPRPDGVDADAAKSE
jgi:chromosome segregation protein